MITTKQLVPNTWCIVRKAGPLEAYWNGRTFAQAFALAKPFGSRAEADAELKKIRRRVNANR